MFVGLIGEWMRFSYWIVVPWVGQLLEQVVLVGKLMAEEVMVVVVELAVVVVLLPA